MRFIENGIKNYFAALRIVCSVKSVSRLLAVRYCNLFAVCLCMGTRGPTNRPSPDLSSSKFVVFHQGPTQAVKIMLTVRETIGN